MYPDDYYNKPYDYLSNNSILGGWLILFILLVLAAVLLKTSDNLIESETGTADNRCSTDGVAEYWYSDTPEHVNSSAAINNTRTNVHKTPVLDKNRGGFNKPNSGCTVKGVFFWI